MPATPHVARLLRVVEHDDEQLLSQPIAANEDRRVLEFAGSKQRAAAFPGSIGVDKAAGGPGQDRFAKEHAVGKVGKELPPKPRHAANRLGPFRLLAQKLRAIEVVGTLGHQVQIEVVGERHFDHARVAFDVAVEARDPEGIDVAPDRRSPRSGTALARVESAARTLHKNAAMLTAQKAASAMDVL